MIIRSMRIGTRLTVAFSALLLLMLIVSFVLIGGMQRMRTITQDIVNVQVSRVSMAQVADSHAQTAANQLLLLLQIDKREERIPLYATMDAELLELDRTVGQIGATLMSHEAHDQFARLTQARALYDELFHETVETIELNGVESARAHFRSKTRAALTGLLQETATMSEQQQQGMQANLEQFKQAEESGRYFIVALITSSLVLGTMLAWFITRSIVTPLKESVAVAENIAQGNLAQTIPLSQSDEMGQLLNSLGLMRDSIVQREDKILKLAYQDTLTSLPNRTHFLESLTEKIAGQSGMVAVLDINRFSLINNALGHAVGDRLLQEVARRLSECDPRPSEMARLWGDKFAFFMMGVSKDRTEQLARTILACLQEPIVLFEQKLDVAGSLGIALFPQDGEDPSSLLRRAEMASRYAKRRHQTVAYAANAGAEPQPDQLSLIGEMRNALKNNEFVVYYQPKLHFATGAISAAEALIRWQHPQRGLIPPFKFIPFAEQTGFIREITPWLIANVIAQAAEWQRRGLDIVPSVNLSTLDLLDRGLVDYVCGMLKQHGVAPNKICLEITESALMEEPELALKHLNELAAKGIKLSIDDYGSGQASLAYLKTLPVNELKIDREFVTAVSSEVKNAAIVRSTIVLCHELGLTVVAEGAETQEELAWLKSNQCDIVQGYGIAKPMPVAQFLAWVGERDLSAERSSNMPG